MFNSDNIAILYYEMVSNLISVYSVKFTLKNRRKIRHKN